MIHHTAELLVDRGLSGIDLKNFSRVQRRKYDTIANIYVLFLIYSLHYIIRCVSSRLLLLFHPEYNVSSSFSSHERLFDTIFGLRKVWRQTKISTYFLILKVIFVLKIFMSLNNSIATNKNTRRLYPPGTSTLNGYILPLPKFSFRQMLPSIWKSQSHMPRVFVPIII